MSEGNRTRVSGPRGAIAQGHETGRALGYFTPRLEAARRIGMGLAVIGARDAEFRGFGQHAFSCHGPHEHYEHKKKHRTFH